MKDTAVVSWFKQQADFTANILNKIPGQEALIQEMTAMDADNSVSYSSITKVGSRYFHYRKNPGDFVAKLCYRDGQSGTEILLFDPKVYSPENDGRAFTILEKNLAMLTDIRFVYSKADIIQKREFVNLVFDSNLYYQEGIYRTPTMLNIFSHNSLIMK